MTQIVASCFLRPHEAGGTLVGHSLPFHSPSPQGPGKGLVPIRRSHVDGRIQAKYLLAKHLIILGVAGQARRHFVSSGPMEELEEPKLAMRGLNKRLKGFLEHVNQLERTNCELEEQIEEWGFRNITPRQDWSEKDVLAQELRAQVGR